MSGDEETEDDGGPIAEFFLQGSPDSHRPQAPLHRNGFERLLTELRREPSFLNGNDDVGTAEGVAEAALMALSDMRTQMLALIQDVATTAEAIETWQYRLNELMCDTCIVMGAPARSRALGAELALRSRKLWETLEKSTMSPQEYPRSKVRR